MFSNINELLNTLKPLKQIYIEYFHIPWAMVLKQALLSWSSFASSFFV